MSGARHPMQRSIALPLSARAPAGGRTAVVLWLFGCALMVFAMAVIGAITRLTESGLSITDWAPVTGAIPPLTAEDWARAFDAYRATPEYVLKNAGMTLAEFQHIYFWEWLHRLWGRLIGVVFALGLAWFWLRGAIDRPLGRRLLGILALGALQGAVGWYMVMSGLVDRPSVSHYRLAMHLGLAVLLYALLLWTAFGLVVRPVTASPGLRRHAWVAIGAVGATMAWGAFVAGLDAGQVYTSWPLMDGQVLPPEAWSIQPAWLNAIDNTALVQFLHRWLAVATGAVVLALAWRLRAGTASGLAAASAAMVVAQIGLGIATLLAAVPVALGALHQAGALVLLTLLIALAARLRSAVPR